MTLAEPILKVAVDTPLRQLFDYLDPVPAEGRGCAAGPGEGARVWVPFGRRRVVGLVMGRAATSELSPERLRRAGTPIDPEPLLDAPLLALLRWAADYYHHPVGEVVATALPALLRAGASLHALTERWSATAGASAALETGQLARAPRQRELLAALLATGPVDEPQLAARLAQGSPGWRDAARALLARGLVKREQHADAAPPAAATVAPRLPQSTALVLGPEQQAAFDAVHAGLDRYGCFLLDGVTGSGKTEVYLRLIAEVLARGRRALMLVPEIGLTPQLTSRVRERFAVQLAVMHSALSDRERLEAWRTARSGETGIVLGTRSAVFAPLPGLGLIVVDEEHDASFKQHEGGFRYSARDLAIVRAQQCGVPVVLGSATPAFETLHNVTTGKAVRLSLPRRAAASEAQPPRIALIDLRAHAPHRGLSTPLVQAIERHLQQQAQVLVFLNRRGYAPTLLCTGCGWIAPCSQCDARMTVHRASDRLACHHCGAEEPLPARCPRCGYPVRPVGQGTERVEEVLGELFPAAPLARFDRDSVRRPEELHALLARVTSGEARLLVGTQMLTKGHHFPDVTLVAVLNADHSLFSADFRAAERLAQTIVQVAGRAGRAARAGEVLIQTEFPEHPLMQSLIAGGYDGFAHLAMAERADARWPPFSRLALLRGSAPDAQAPIDFLSRARHAADDPAGVRLLGPVPAAMRRRAGRYHAQLLIESNERGALHRFLNRWLPQVEALPERGVRWVLDVDPLEVL